MKKLKPKLKSTKPTVRVLKDTETRAEERLRFKGRMAVLNKSSEDQGKQIRKQADELNLKDRQLQLGVDKQERSKEQIHLRSKAMEATADGIFIIDALKTDFPVIYTNQSFQTMTGYSRREIVGRDYFLHYGPSADPRLIDEMKKTMRQGRSFHGEMLNFKKDGTKYWNLLRITPVRDSNGVVTHYVGTKTDVSLMRQRDMEIKEQREELLHVTRVGKLAEFVSSLAHEISQPLTAILSYSQAAQRMLADREPQVKEIFGHIINDDQRAAEVIRRLRMLLKKSEPELKPLNINAIINETVVLIATDVTVRNNIIKTELDFDIPIVLGDRIQLQQVLLNLVSNSFDAMEGMKDKGEILIRSTLKDPEKILVEVKDSGCGVPEKNMNKLFSHFFTSKPDGLGMGLSISRSIVEAHGGRLDMKNNSDYGATFYFTIPVHIKEDL